MGAASAISGIKLRPDEQAAAVDAGAALQRRDEDDVPLQALGFVDGEEVDEGLTQAG